jgi:hypothetical protein
MKPVRARASREIIAAPTVVYAILADYREHHPRILPTALFESTEVEEGGRGAGTVIVVRTKIFGQRQTMRMTVTEPDPGRVLQETDAAAGVTTTFTVTAIADGARSLVEITTEWSGPRGILDRIFIPLVAGMIYKKELELLAAYAAQSSTS